MRINYILDSNFPTEKAYGVTTENTLSCLKNMGHDVYLFCHKPNILLEHKFPDAQIFYFKYSGLNKILRSLSLSGKGKFSIIIWNLSRYITFFENRRIFRMEDCDVIWTRDNPTPQYVKMLFKGIEVIEIHSIPSRRTINLLSGLDPKKMVLCPISKSLEAYLSAKLPNSHILWSPMGVTHESRSENEMAVEIEKHYGAREKPLTIGYFGKLAPSGISKGYEDILDLSLELSKKIKDFKILFIGIGISELQMLMNEIEHRGVDRDKILIQTHLPHSKNLELMKNCHFLVLPANKDPKYFGFPLKALEYVISLRLIIAGDTQINREVFVDEFQPIWYGRNEISKLADLVASCHNLEFLKKYLVSGVKYAEQFTWHRRTTKILASIQDLSGI